VLLLEPKTTLNTGNIGNERTVADLERIQSITVMNNLSTWQNYSKQDATTILQHLSHLSRLYCLYPLKIRHAQ
jgi:hypothetical protein